jgi:hypothetical protein
MAWDFDGMHPNEAAISRDGRCPPDEAVFDTRYACTSLDTDTLMLMFAPHTQTSASTLVAVASW